MPFRHEYSDADDQQTLDRLQDVFEYVWLALVDMNQSSPSREQVARFIIEAHETGMSPEQMKDFVIHKFRWPVCHGLRRVVTYPQLRMERLQFLHPIIPPDQFPEVSRLSLSLAATSIWRRTSRTIMLRAMLW
jgi:hypothetical protein